MQRYDSHRLYPEEKFYCCNAAHMSFDEKFDTVVLHNILEHTSEKTREDIFDRIEELLLPDGIVIFAYLNAYNIAHMISLLWWRGGIRQNSPF